MSRASLVFVWLLFATVFGASLTSSASQPMASKAFAIHDGDSVVFLGDSITEQRLYTRYIEDFVVTRYPKMRVKFFNAGWSGDTAAGGLRRLERDVLSHKPTLVTVCFGMNDAGYRPLDEGRLSAYRQAMDGIVSALKTRGVRVVLLTPTVVDPDTRPELAGYNDVLARYADVVKEIGAREGLLAVDLHTPFLAAQEKGKAERGSRFTMIPDGIHPAPAGHLLMASLVLEAMGAEPLVSAVTVDAFHSDVQAKKCRVRNLQAKGRSVAFERLDSALPWAVDTLAERLLSLVPVYDDLNQYSLRVLSLPSGQYRIMVDGVECGRASAEELAAGVNLAKLRDMPEVRDALAVDSLTAAKENLDFTTWRTLDLGTSADLPGKADALEAMRKWVYQVEAKRRQLAQPHTHRFEVVEVR